MKKVKLFESFLSEANKGKVHKAAKQGSYPAVIVVVQDGKVIHQEPVSTPEVAPATFNVMQEKYPKALLHLEDNTGKRLFSESVDTNEEYDGVISDFKYEFPIKFEEETGNSSKAIKKIAKKGKGYEVRTSTYMSQAEMEKVGLALGLKLKSYVKDSRISISIYESVVTEKREDVGKYNTVKKVINKLGRRPSEQDLATFINNNYYDVTEVERGDDDERANDKIADLVGFYKFDIDDWEIAWEDAQNESLVTEASEDRMIKQIERALKDGTSIFKLPMATQKYYNKKKSEFEVVTEAKYTKKSLLKAMTQDDGDITTADGKEYVVYKYAYNRRLNNTMWQDDVVMALDQDGEEWEIKYSDIASYNESVVTEAKNTIGLAFKEEEDYLDFKEFVAEQPRGAIRKNIGFDIKTKSWNVEMDVKVLDSIYGEGTPSDKKSGWYGGLPDDFESVIIESVVTEEVAYNSSNTKPEAAKQATKEFGKLLPKANKGVEPYVFAVVKTKARNYRLAIKSGSYVAHEFMSGLKEDGILTTADVKKAVANVIKLNPEEFNESSVTEGKNTIGLAFKEEQDYLDFKEFVADQPRGAIRKNIGFDSKTKSWNVEMDVKVLDSIYGEGTPSNKESGWYGGLPDDFESVIIESTVTEYRGDGTNKISDDKLMNLIPKMSKGYVGKNTGTGEYTISTPGGEEIVLTQSKDKKNWSYEPSNIALKILNESVVTEGIFDSIADPIKALHFETDPKTAELMKMELGKKQGETNKKKQIDSAEYSLKRFRKSIKFGDGTYLGVFLPGSYDASVSTLGDGPHKKAVAKVKWSQKKYDQWLEDMAANGGADNAFDMAQNAKNETGLIDWVKKEFRGDDPLQRIQWDIEAFAESVVTEAVELVESFKKFKDHIASINDGAGSTAEVYFNKGKGYYVVVSGEYDYDFDAKDKKELTKKLKDNEFTNEPFEGSI